MTSDAQPDAALDDGAITVYWRPGCGFCAGLLRGLERQELRFDRVNIWDDPEGAAFVRSVARGNETVPTVRVGDLALVNPSAREVLRTVAERAPERLPPDLAPDDLAATGPERLVQRLFGR